jgi:hypothetical protein
MQQPQGVLSNQLTTGVNMKNVIQKALHGGAGVFSKGRSFKIGVLLAGLVASLAVLSPNASAITQLEYLQIMVQVSGDGASFSASSTPADFVQWARNRGLEPSGGWNANASLTPGQLAESLVHLYGLNVHKLGGDFFRILEREGISIDRSSSQVTRTMLANLLDNVGFQSRQAVIARSSHTDHGNGNGHGNDDDDDDDDDDDNDDNNGHGNDHGNGHGNNGHGHHNGHHNDHHDNGHHR